MITMRGVVCMVSCVWPVLVCLIIDAGAADHLLITEVYYDTYLPDDPEEFIRICNPTENDVNLSGFYISDLEGDSIFPDGCNITVGDCIVVARGGNNYTEQGGERPDFEMIDTNIAIPDMSGNLRLANTGDEVLLKDTTGTVIDAFIYGNSQYDGSGWNGEAITLVDSNQFQKYYTNNYYLVRNRKRNESIEGQYIDTDSADDWDNNRMEDYVRYIGWSRFDYPKYFTHSGDITLFNSPDTSYLEITRFIDSASTNLYISLYDWDNFHIMDHLINASLRGVEIKVLLDGDSNDFNGVTDANKYIAQQVEAAGGDVAWMVNDVLGTRNRYASLHAKYVIADEKDVLIMSGNWKYSSVPVDPSMGNREWNVIIWNNSEIANFLIDVFNDDYDTEHKDIAEYCTLENWCEASEDFTPNRTIDHGDYTYPFSSKDITVSNMSVEVILSPDTSMFSTKAIMGMLKSVGNRSKVYWDEFYAWKCWGLPKKDCDPESKPNIYLEEAINAARRGAEVKIIIDSTDYNINDTNENQDTIAYVNDIASSEGLDLEARLANHTKIHNKGMIVDNKTLISSININFHSTHLNRELGIIITNPEIANYFKNVFLYDWNGTISTTTTSTTTSSTTTITVCCTGADTNCDGIVGDSELLDYVDGWVQGEVTDFELLDAIEAWATGICP